MSLGVDAEHCGARDESRHVRVAGKTGILCTSLHVGRKLGADVTPESAAG